MATAEYDLHIGENKAQQVVTGAKGVVPDWRRWNNYGIALFDQKQYALAVDAFARVAELDETYRPMALVNRALALIELDRWSEASKLVDSAIELNPKLMRAVFQRARIRAREGQLEAAEADIRQVLSAFPRDRISLQQLGELSKVKRDYAAARNAYEQILQIDPEDAGAHYNLMLIYRKLGMRDEAKQEAKLFADLKDDPAALPIASEFLRRHPEMKGESSPWHVHTLGARRNNSEVAQTEDR
jgi:tetratricopeptide (TPR) repeat protein